MTPTLAMLPAVSLHVDREAVLAYAAITDDFNPVHVDEAFAATTAFGRPIAHGMLSLNLIWQSLRQALGSGVPVSMDIRFVRPVLMGMRVTSGGAARSDGPGYEVWVRDETGEAVITGVAIPGGEGTVEGYPA
ncbi:MaoC family dehydratase [Roseomonas xinghualingensis]|uniref:MaoC family dehydratase n=1 Tax=Roseomonas xinghualingensis TaxID=2986475 RepID=UPI0021F199B3|nr:MaoC/PaaZ C-terminal domain-containing protein [Roseomonas sp. SXEYE001]MCV4209222.1 MaoC/PaaZ C-terminal domain-containing protein [Roseomonas sp. SXEYE001]